MTIVNILDRLETDEPVSAVDTDITDDKPLVHAYPTFNIDDFYGIAGEVARLATVDSEADPMAVYISFLTCSAALLGRYKFIRIGETRHYPRLFSALVGQSSRARKGTSLKPVIRVLRKTEEVYVRRENNAFPPYESLVVADGGLSSAEGLIFAVRDESESTKKGGDPLWNAVQDKRLLVVEEELANVLKMTQREGNTLSPILRRAWDGGTLAPMTKNNQLKATDPHINLLSHITQMELKLMLSGQEKYNGLANRFLWSCVRRPKKVPFPRPMDDDKVLNIAIRLSDFMKNINDEQELNLSKDAAHFWSEVYQRISTDETGLKAALTARSEAYVIRLSLLFALLDNSLVVDVCHIKAALAVIEYCNQSAEYIFTAVDDEAVGDAKKLLDAITVKPLSQTEVSKVFHGHKNRREIKAILEELQSMGKIRQKKSEGSKKIIWEKI